MSGATPLIAANLAADGSDHPVAWRNGQPVPAARFLADVRHLAARLPPRRHLLNLCGDRYRFAVAFCAAVLAGRISLLPPNHSAGLLARLRELYPDLLVIRDNDQVDANGLPVHPYPLERDDSAAWDHALASGNMPTEVPSIADDAVVAHVFTSGSTGVPTAHEKRWASLVFNVRSEALRLGIQAGSATTLIGTVPAQHMYGFESTVLLALHNRIAFNGGSPFYPADIIDAIEAVPGARILVTTPFHLRTLMAVSGPMPALQLIVSATAPLATALAHEAEQRFGAPLLEIYGCTEAGQLATRRPVDGEQWETFRGVTIERRESSAAAGGGVSVGGGNDDSDTAGSDTWIAQGGHIIQPTPLSDLLELESPTRFRLLGRGADMVNVAGKRNSLGYLNHLLTAIPGVTDGAFFNPDSGQRDVTRLMAFFVSDSLAERDILAALRARTDSVFLPRPLIRVDRLPRSATGKLPQAALAEFAQRCLAERAGDASQRRIEIDIAPDHPAFDGHFPGKPILPGVVLLAEVLTAIEKALARSLDGLTIRNAKFHAPVIPEATKDSLDSKDSKDSARTGTRLVIDLAIGADIAFTVHSGNTRVASGSVRLPAS